MYINIGTKKKKERKKHKNEKTKRQREQILEKVCFATVHQKKNVQYRFKRFRRFEVFLDLQAMVAFNAYVFFGRRSYCYDDDDDDRRVYTHDLLALSPERFLEDVRIDVAT